MGGAPAPGFSRKSLKSTSGFLEKFFETIAVREAREETSLEVTLKTLLGNYSDPARDARGHTVSAVYVAEARGEPRAADDARHLALFAPDEAPALAFDHARILEDYRRHRQTGELTPLHRPA